MAQMNYQKASPNSGRGISASQWNGLLDMHRDFYNGGASNGILPPLLSQSVIASAVLNDDVDDVAPFQPVRIVSTVNYVNVLDGPPSYIVEPVDATDGERHGNYGFTLGEGCTSGFGGRIVVSGIALVAVEALELYYDKQSEIREGRFDSSYYMVPDETLSTDLRPIAPVGHFKILSWYDASKVGAFESDKTLYIAIDMNQRPTSFLAKVDATIDATSEASEVITMSSGTAYAYYGVSASTAASGELEVQKDEDAYEIEVYNPFDETIQSGLRMVSYSLEYNKFVILSNPQQQTVKIGVADADIEVGTIGTISIWRSGSDTLENQDAKLDWMAGTTKVSSGKEVLITWFEDENTWRITGAECED